jgi:predicted amidohydrolase
MEAIGLIADQVKTCESIGVEFLCCPEGILGGLADYASRPYEIARDVQNGHLRRAKRSRRFSGSLKSARTVDSSTLRRSFAKGRQLACIASKLHPATNRSIYDAGHDTPVFTLGDVTFGIVICLDCTYREPARAMAYHGAIALFVPTNNGLPPAKGRIDIVEHARDTDVARAKENGVSAIRADVAGRVDGLVSYGSSSIVDRNGAGSCMTRPSPRRSSTA